MRTQNLKSILFILILTIFNILFTSCDSSDEEAPTALAPQLIENYYFRGQLDNVEFALERKVYNTYIETTGIIPYTIDFGGSQTQDYTNDGIDNCRGTYACGIYVHQSNVYDQMKMYFYNTPVGACTLDNEIISMEDYLGLGNYSYRDYYDFNNVVFNEVGFEYYPPNSNPSDYYSSRFGDNTNATFEISSFTEESRGVYFVEGTFSCKLYNFVDNTQFKELQNGEFKIKIRSNLEDN